MNVDFTSSRCDRTTKNDIRRRELHYADAESGDHDIRQSRNKFDHPLINLDLNLIAGLLFHVLRNRVEILNPIINI